MNNFISTTATITLGLTKHLVLLITCILLVNGESKASVTITKASGGTGISADNAANGLVPVYTSLGNIILTEGIITDFASGSGLTFTLSAPGGWTFNSSASVSATAAPGKDISSVTIVSKTSTLITIQVTVSGTLNSDILTIAGIEIRANDGGNVPGTSNITKGGTATISGCASGVSLGTLSQSTGNLSKLVITLPGQTFSDANTLASSGNTGTVNSPTAGNGFALTKIRACDQFYNVVSGYAGFKTLSYSGPSNGISSPAYTTTVSFSSGVSSTVLNTTLKKSETTTISVSDGVYSGPQSSAITINPGVLSNFLVESSAGGNINTQITGVTFNIKLTARDANNNSCSSGSNIFSGAATITSSGTFTSGGGTTAVFSGGILSSHSIIIANPGNFTITATKTAGIESGSSNSFTVNPPPSVLTGITPSCITPGNSAFALTINGSNFTGSSVVRFNGSDRSTTFLSSTQIIGNILISDIASPGIYSISVNTPGAGSTSPVILNMNTESTANIAFCPGSTHILPDGASHNSPGTYTSVIPNSAGCDSTIITYLAADSSASRTDSIIICPGTTYVLPDGLTESIAGTYISLIPNPPGCDSIITTVLAFYQAPDLTATPVQIDCYGNTGSVVLNTVNGLPFYTYGPEATTNLSAGTYYYSVTDLNGCADSDSATINSEPSQLVLTATPSQIACFNGTGSVNRVASGGSSPYTYNNTSTSNLTAGTYNYQVTDNNGCSASATANINVSPGAMAALSSATSTPCGSSTGSATVTASGGTAPYSYSWNTNPVRTTRSITGLPTGNYSVIVTDNNGCTISKTVTVNNSNSTPLTITGSTGICPGATTALCASAGFASYLWSTGDTSRCIAYGNADTLYITAIDTLGCSSIKNVILHNSTLPTCSISGGTLCPNSSVVLRSPTGYPYYLWNNGTRTSYYTARSAGTFSVIIKNTDGCSSTCSYTVNTPLKIAVTKTDGKCANEYKGTARVTANSGLPPYRYLWSNGATTASISGLNAGSYTVRVTDSAGCSVAFTTVISSNITTYDYSAIATIFNSNTINPGSMIWFSSVININYTGNYPVTLRFINQNISSSKFSLTPSNARLIITNAVTQATTTYTGGEWITTAPPNLAGNYFVGGYAYPVTTSIAGNLNPVKWKGIWTASSSCVSILRWKWSAATYTNFVTNYSLLNIKPVDDIAASQYSNGDYAGTPEDYKGDCISGALSTGITDYVGTYSALLNRLPCSTQDVCTGIRLAGSNFIQEEGSNFLVRAYPNPFKAQTKIEFEWLNQPSHLFINVYSLLGKKIKTIFDGDIEAGVLYSTEFDAGDLNDGIYIYRFITDGEEISGKLFIQK